MKRYISNLLTALTGKNPYEHELQQVRSEMREAALQLQKLDRSCQDLHRLHNSSEKMLRSYQTLVENLRQRLAEKDALIDQMKVG